MPGVESLQLSPQLFADGADPSGAPACAIVNPERGLFRFVDLPSLSVSDVEDAVAPQILDDVALELESRRQPAPEGLFLQSVVNGKDFGFVLRKGAAP